MDDKIHKLYIEVSSRCNLNCRMCFRRTWVDERFGDLEFSAFSRVLDDPALEDTETVFFGGMGEPLIHPDLISMVSMVSQRGKKAELITNGTLLNEKRASELISAGIGRIWVSIDEIYENYDKIQIGSDFELVRGNLDKFNDLRRGTPVKLGMTAVIMRDNITNLSRIRDFAVSYKADDLNLSHILPNRPEDTAEALWAMCDVASCVSSYTRDGGFEPELPMFGFRSQDVQALFGDDTQKALDAALFSWKGRPYTRKMNYCRFIEEGNCFIRWDGDVSPCMGLLHSSDSWLLEHKRRFNHYSFGNVYEKSLGEIWNSEEYSRFRERVRRFEFAPCLYCWGCEELKENKTDCIGSPAPVCGGCLWGQGFIVCP